LDRLRKGKNRGGLSTDLITGRWGSEIEEGREKREVGGKDEERVGKDEAVGAENGRFGCRGWKRKLFVVVCETKDLDET